jgi:intracellular sulfur oxidation DsrE/DsrF family protein
MKFKSLLFALTALLVSSTGWAQGNSPKKDNLLFLLRQTEHINQAIKTIDQLQAGQATTLKPGTVVIIVCGEAVKALTAKEAEGWVQKTSAYPGVSIMACGLSLAKFGVTQGDLVKGVQYTENGFIKAFELQKAGYLSVEL